MINTLLTVLLLTMHTTVLFDFQKAFNKALHQNAINAAATCGLEFKATLWLVSFLSGRSQPLPAIEVGNWSSTLYVLSGEMQGSVLSPALYVMLTNALLRTLGFQRNIGMHSKVANVFTWS